MRPGNEGQPDSSRSGIALGSRVGPTVVIDSTPQGALRRQDADAVVCVDVMLSSTTLITAVSAGIPAFVAWSATEARERAQRQQGALLAGSRDLGPVDGCERLDSPVGLLSGPAPESLVLYSPPGTEMMLQARPKGEVLVACLRNLSATIRYLAETHRSVALLGAGRGEEFSCEDQMACAWLAARLMLRGFRAGDRRTWSLVERWDQIGPELVGWGNSAELLRQSGRGADVDFVIAHQDDLDLVGVLAGAEVVSLGSARSRRAEPAARVPAGSHR